MQFEIDHEIAAPLESVEAALLSTDFAAQVERSFAAMATLQPQVHDRDDHGLVRVWRFQAHAPLRLLERFDKAHEWLSWEDRFHYDCAAHQARWEIVPRGEDEPTAPWRRFFLAAGHYELAALDGERTRRRVGGELAVHVPILGRLVERAGLHKLRRAYADEAEVLQACCKR